IRILLATIGGALFAFAGAPQWTTVPLTVGVALLVLVTRPRVAMLETRFIDVSLASALFAIALQLVPIPSQLRPAMTPAAVAFDRAARVGGGLGSVRAGAISVEPAATAAALVAVVLA